MIVILKALAYAICAFIAFIAYRIASNYVWLMRMRRRYGKRAVYDFSLLFGAYGEMFESMHTRTSAHELTVQRLKREAPHAKALVTASIFDRQIWFVDGDLIKHVLVDKVENYVKAPLFMSDYVLGKGLVMSEGAQWKRQRHLLSQSFHFDQLKSHVPTVQALCAKHVARIKASREYAAGAPIDLIQVFQNVTGEVVLKRFFGCNVEDLNVPRDFSICNETAEVVQQLLELGVQVSVAVKRLLFGGTYWQSALFGKGGALCLHNAVELRLIDKVDYLKSVIRTLIEERIQRAKTHALGDCLLDVLVRDYYAQAEDARAAYCDEIVHQCITFLIAGIDTTSVLLTYSFYYLGKYPDVQAKVYDEVRALNFLSSADTDAISRCAYTGMFLKEALRFSGMASGLFERVATKTHTIGSDASSNAFVVEKGDHVDVRLVLSMWRPENCPDAAEFRPERWRAENSVAYHHFWMIPFSAGARNCIGQHLAQIEAKLMLAEMLKNFVVELNPAKVMKISLRLVVMPIESHLNVLRERKVE